MSEHHPLLSVTLTYPDQTSITLRGEGVILHAACGEDDHLTAITGRLTLGHIAQLMSEIVQSFGLEETVLAMSIAMLSLRMDDEEN